MKLSIDLGGTNIRIAQVEKGNCLNKVSVPCLAQQDASTVLNQLSQLIRNMMNEQVDGIGIGVPSIVDPEKGIVYSKYIFLERNTLEGDFGERIQGGSCH